MKEIPSPKHCPKLIRKTGVLLRFQDQQHRQLRNSVEAPIRQVYLQGTATSGQTQFNTKARQFPVNYGTAALSTWLLALVKPVAQNFCTDFVPLRY